jgi:outer membrane biosynthesis protein TonB
MFDFIKNLFSGIAAFFGGLFGGKKSQDNALTAPKTKKAKGYYLELDDTGNAQSAAEAKKPESVKAEVQKPEPVKAEVQKPEPVKAAAATAAPPKVDTAVEQKKPEPAKASAASKNGKVKIEAQPNPPAPSNNGKIESQDELTFAPKYLIPTATNSRRRPGPSMDMFRDMARQVKTPG